LVCSGRRRLNVSQGMSKFSAGQIQLGGDEHADQHADESPHHGHDGELADDPSL
jgi:hypothetical protein